MRASGWRRKRAATAPVGAAPGQLSPARLGHFAPALLGLPDPDHPLREMRRGAGAGEGSAGDAAGGRHLRQAGQSARPPSDLEERQVPAMRRPGAARDRHHGHLRRLVLVLRRASPIRGTSNAPTDAEDRQRLDAGRPIYRRHRARDFASACIRASSPARCTRPATSIWTSRSPACSRKAWWCTRPTAPRTATGSSRPKVKIEGAGDARRATLAATGEPVEIGAIEKMSKSKKNTVDPDDIIAAYGADTARWFMLSDSPPERDVIWTRGRRAGRLALRAAAVAADRRDRRTSRRRRRGPRNSGAAGAGRAQGGAPRAGQRVGGHRPAALQPLRRAHLRMRQRAVSDAIGGTRNRARRPISPGPCARPATSWCGCSTR